MRGQIDFATNDPNRHNLHVVYACPFGIAFESLGAKVDAVCPARSVLRKLRAVRAHLRFMMASLRLNLFFVPFNLRIRTSWFRR